MKRLLLFASASLVVLLLAAVALVVTDNHRPGPAVEDIVEERWQGSEYGLVVGIVNPLERRIVSRGAIGHGNRQEVDGDTLFELCSVTKVLTSLLLADMVDRGEVALGDPIDTYLPESVSCPEKNGARITLLHLATHASGLPSRPYRSPAPAAAPVEPADTPGYATLTEGELYRFLAAYELTREPGSDFEYSNIGMGLLGHILALRAGTSYEQLLAERILVPLGMVNTRITLPPESQTRLALGHYRNGDPARHWMLSTPLVGAGAVRSTANDMLAFLAANLEIDPTPLGRAMRMTHQVRRETEGSGVRIGLGWAVLDRDGHEIWLHSGGVPGYRSFIGFSKQQSQGVVVLGNSSTDVEDIGLYLLDTAFGLIRSAPPVIKEPAVVDPSLYDAYAGHYQVTEGAMIAVWKESDKLFLQITRQPRFELLPEAEARFFISQPDAQVVFLTADGDEVSELVLYQSGREIHCPRLPPVETAAIDAAVAESYAGRYRVDASRAIMVTRESDRLFVQPTLRPREEIYPRTASEYFARISDTEVTFVTERHGEVARLVLRQGRDEMVATKTDEQILAFDLPQESLEELAGLYQHSPDFQLTVTRLGDRLFIQGSHQPMHELYPRSSSRFFLKTAPAPGEVSFHRDRSGTVTSLTVHAGRETETSRKITGP